MLCVYVRGVVFVVCVLYIYIMCVCGMLCGTWCMCYGVYSCACVYVV